MSFTTPGTEESQPSTLEPRPLDPGASTLRNADNRSAGWERWHALRKTGALWLLAFACAGCALWGFDRHNPAAVAAFFSQFRALGLWPLTYGLLSLYAGFGLRAVRWSILLRPKQTADWRKLLAPQLIGFAAVALFGRAADLARPYLVARRLETPVAMQVAVYSIERAFDLAAAAMLFSLTLAFAPRSIPHHAAYARAGELCLAATAVLVAVACAIRFGGEPLTRRCASLLARLSPGMAGAVAARLRDLQEGFRTLTSLGQVAGALAVSLAIWSGIVLAYLGSARAFRSTPELAGMTFTGIMLLFATSLGASLLQFPILGWFTQVAALAAAYHAFYGVSVQTASACGAVTLCITTLSVIPGGLVAAQIAGESLRQSVRLPAGRE